jgi:O-antigen/teichoic acid export membrane protein
MRKVAQIFFPVFIFCFIFADQIITLLFTSEYRGSVEVFRIYLCLLPLRLAAYRTILSAIGQTKPILGATSIAFVTSALVGTALEATVGLKGPALGSVTGEVVSIWYMLWYSKKTLDVSWLDLIPLQKLAPPFWGAVVIGMVILPCHFFHQGSVALLGLYIVCYFGLYITFMRVFKFFTEEDWALICRCVTLKVLSQQK